MNRIYYPAADIVRILAGMGVILIHVTDLFITYPPYVGIGGSSWWIVTLVNAFFRPSVPLFIMLSGYLLLTEKALDAKKFYKRRLARIGIPAVFWVIFFFVWNSFHGKPATPESIFHDLATVSVSHLYFLVIIFELYFITPFLLIFFKNSTKKMHKVLYISLAIFTLGTGAIFGLYPEDSVNLSKNILTIFLPYIFYYVASLFVKKIKLSLPHTISLALMFCYMALFTAVVSGGHIFSYFRQYTSITVLIMTLIAFVALMQLNNIKILQENRVVKKVLEYWSSLIFGAYLIHMMVIEFFNTYKVMVPGEVGNPMWIYAFLKVIIVIGISFGVVAIGKKLPVIKYLST